MFAHRARGEGPMTLEQIEAEIAMLQRQQEN
jgi:hypothetical protein